MPGAPTISGTDEDPSHFYHQPPPVDGINFGSQSDSIDHPDSQETSRIPEALRRATRGRRGTRVRSHSQDQAVAEDTDSPDSPVAGSPVAGSPCLSPASPVSPIPSSPPNGNHPTPPSPANPDTPRRARFPEEPAKLTRTYSAPQRAPTTHSTNNADSYDGEKDREPARHRGVWQSFRNWMSAWKHDLGAPAKEQDLQDLIGDIGIDLQTIRKITGGSGKKGKKNGGNHNRVASLIAPSIMLARPGLGTRTESSSTMHTIGGTTTNGSTAPTSGTVTPGTARKIFGVGVDPQELSKALKKIKSKVHHGDSKQAKYVQAKSELAHRRNLVLLMVSCYCTGYPHAQNWR